MQDALADFRDGVVRLPLAIALAREDIKDRYRRSYLGVTWIIAAFLAFILVKALIFSGLFQGDEYDYFSHLVIGFALFGFISMTVTEGAGLFVRNRTWILSSNLPYTLYAHVTAIKAIFELSLIGLAAVALIAAFGRIQPAHIWSIPIALCIYYVTAIAIATALGPLGARFRDLVHAVQTTMRALFFATPIIWVPTPDSIRGTVAKYNPLTYYIDVIRVPIIEGRFPAQSWLVVLTTTGVLVAIGVFIFSQNKKTVPIWL